MKKIPKLTDLEIKIMKVLWDYNTCLTIQEISNNLKEEKISVASITQAMKRMVTKKAVAVKDHVLVSNVYARTFTPSFSQEEFLIAEMQRLQHSVFGTKRISRNGLITTLLNLDGEEEIKLEEVETLQKIINDKKNRLLNEDI